MAELRDSPKMKDWDDWQGPKFVYDIKYTKTEYNEMQVRVGKMDDAEDILRLGDKEISRLSDYLNLDASVSAAAERLFESTVNSELAYNHSIGELSTAAVYSACKKENCPRKASEIYGGSILSKDDFLPARFRIDLPRKWRATQFGNVKKAPSTKSGSKLGKINKRMVDHEKIDIEYQLFEPADFLNRYIDLLELEQGIVQACLTCIQRHSSFFNRRSPSAAAAVSLWYVSDHLGLEPTHADIGVASGYNLGQISRRKSSIERRDPD